MLYYLLSSLHYVITQYAFLIDPACGLYAIADIDHRNTRLYYR